MILKILFIIDYNYDDQYVELDGTKLKKIDDARSEKVDDRPLEKSEEFADIEPMPPLGLKILIQNKLLTRPPVLLPQKKSRSNSYELKIEIKQILYLLHQHNKITKRLYNNLIKSL